MQAPPANDQAPMLSLILFRHAKSDWNASFETDHDRPLADRGRANARCMGRFLAQTHQLPDVAVSSSAKRARDTLALAMDAGRWHCTVRIDGQLYAATSTAVLAWMQALEGRPERLLLVGHEPTWSDLAGRLVGDAVVKVPTGAMLRLDFDANQWREVAFGQAELRWLMPPKVACRLKGLA